MEILDQPVIPHQLNEDNILESNQWTDNFEQRGGLFLSGKRPLRHITRHCMGRTCTICIYNRILV